VREGEREGLQECEGGAGDCRIVRVGGITGEERGGAGAAGGGLLLGLKGGGEGKGGSVDLWSEQRVSVVQTRARLMQAFNG